MPTSASKLSRSVWIGRRQNEVMPVNGRLRRSGVMGTSVLEPEQLPGKRNLISSTIRSARLAAGNPAPRGWRGLAFTHHLELVDHIGQSLAPDRLGRVAQMDVEVGCRGVAREP